MNKNRSVKDNSMGRGRGSRGKEISIDLEARPPRKPDATTSRCEQIEPSSNNVTERMNNSISWQQNPSISQNILKEIISYSNGSQPGRGKGASLTNYEKTEDVYTQLAKINKKASMGDGSWSKSYGMRRQSKKLAIDHSIQASLNDAANMSKSIDLFSKQSPQEQNNQQQSPVMEKPSPPLRSAQGIATSQKPQTATYDQLMLLQAQKQEYAIKIDELSLIESTIFDEYSEMIPAWQSIILSESNCQILETQVNSRQILIKQQQQEIDVLNSRLLFITKQFVHSRRAWDEKGSSGRSRVLDQAEYTHCDFIRRLTIRDFQQTVLFDMKVVIMVDQRCKNSVKAVYQELFRSRSTKKFTMILKKHTSQMDLYDGKLLCDFAKRINDLEGQYWRSEVDTPSHPDQQFLSRMEETTLEIDRQKLQLDKNKTQLESVCCELQVCHKKHKLSESSLLVLIDELNWQVRGQYVRQTQKQADFKGFLLAKYSEIYKEFKQARFERVRLLEQMKRLQIQVLAVRSALLG